MILLWSKHQTGPAAQVIRYLLETEVTKRDTAVPCPRTIAGRSHPRGDDDRQPALPVPVPLRHPELGRG